MSGRKILDVWYILMFWRVLKIQVAKKYQIQQKILDVRYFCRFKFVANFKKYWMSGYLIKTQQKNSIFKIGKFGLF